MALASLVTACLLAAMAASVEASTSTTRILKGKVSCLDCDAVYDLSEIVVMVKCEKAGRVVTATTAKDGGFATELPSDECEARLGGGRNQLYAARKDMVAEIVRVGDGSGSGDVYGTSTPLAFCSGCRCRSIDNDGGEQCKAAARKFGSSKTFDLPLPPEWGLAPSSYYFPFFPIIGIP
ncbi:uncharacterized protein LOC111490782 [Cucurbita maxima]|uniref:Uncharacterized protein LOC111490782 n=1 Tax=Cucurbita maxima TaxID=3661 RepID=A0A6J1K3C6_CUCMA|nr:uncharacterized protein LOC111490782 [Cucurbita maxima]